jgi:hypothetical protein
MEIVNGFSFESVKFGDLALMGTHFPELESLTLRDLGKPFEGNLAVMPRLVCESCASLTWAVLSLCIITCILAGRLRRLHIDTLIARYSPTCIYLDKSELGSLITAVLEACPLLEDLSLCHGVCFLNMHVSTRVICEAAPSRAHACTSMARLRPVKQFCDTSGEHTILKPVQEECIFPIKNARAERRSRHSQPPTEASSLSRRHCAGVFSEHSPILSLHLLLLLILPSQSSTTVPNKWT